MFVRQSARRVLPGAEPATGSRVTLPAVAQRVENGRRGGRLSMRQMRCGPLRLIAARRTLLLYFSHGGPPLSRCFGGAVCCLSALATVTFTHLPPLFAPAVWLIVSRQQQHAASPRTALCKYRLLHGTCGNWFGRTTPAQASSSAPAVCCSRPCSAGGADVRPPTAVRQRYECNAVRVLRLMPSPFLPRNLPQLRFDRIRRVLRGVLQRS